MKEMFNRETVVFSKYSPELIKKVLLESIHIHYGGPWMGSVLKMDGSIPWTVEKDWRGEVLESRFVLQRIGPKGLFSPWIVGRVHSVEKGTEIYLVRERSPFQRFLMIGTGLFLLYLNWESFFEFSPEAWYALCFPLFLTFCWTFFFWILPRFIEKELRRDLMDLLEGEEVKPGLIRPQVLFSHKHSFRKFSCLTHFGRLEMEARMRKRMALREMSHNPPGNSARPNAAFCGYENEGGFIIYPTDLLAARLSNPKLIRFSHEVDGCLMKMTEVEEKQGTPFPVLIFPLIFMGLLFIAMGFFATPALPFLFVFLAVPAHLLNAFFENWRLKGYLWFLCEM